VKLKMRRRTFWVGIAAVIFALTLMCGLLFSFNINLPGELESARARWEAQDIDDYRYSAGFGSYSAVAEVRITVLDGRVALIEQYENPLYVVATPAISPKPIASAPDWYVEYFSGSLPDDLSHYTMDALFTHIEQNFDLHSRPLVEMCNIHEPETNWRTEVQYDVDLGYIEDINFTDCGIREWGVGLACVSLFHCRAGVRISEFEPLPNN
jgi:hypothetical protein